MTAKKLFEKLNNIAKKVVDGAGQIMGNVSESQANKEAENNTSHTMYEVFTAAFGMGKKFIITESSLIYGTEEYTYSQLTPIRIVNPPMPLSNGTASTVANGKELVLAFECSQKGRFAKAMTYANEQIDLANGTVRNYKYVLQSEQGTKIEVYEDYILLYALKSGIGSIVGNSIQGGSGGKVIYFTDMTISLNETAENIVLQIAPQNADVVSVVLNTEQKTLAQDIIAYINETMTAEATKTEFVPEAWEQVGGAAKGIAAATAFNLVRDGAEAGLLKGASQINQAQQLELYQRINPDNLFELVFIDFWRVFLSLTFTLNQNGKAIWYPTDDLAQQASNIFQNLSNPNFPQDKVLDVFFDILKTNPYVEDYHNFMFAKFGDTAETQAIKNYFNV